MSEENSWYGINDIEKFVDTTRALVFNSFGKGSEQDDLDTLLSSIHPDEQDEFNTVLSHEESMIITKNLLKKRRNKKSQKIQYFMNDNLFLEIVESLNNRMISNMLNGLVNKGLLETAFDTESNDFVFWIKDNEQNKETPETD